MPNTNNAGLQAILGINALLLQVTLSTINNNPGEVYADFFSGPSSPYLSGLGQRTPQPPSPSAQSQPRTDGPSH